MIGEDMVGRRAMAEMRVGDLGTEEKCLGNAPATGRQGWGFAGGALSERKTDGSAIMMNGLPGAMGIELAVAVRSQRRGAGSEEICKKKQRQRLLNQGAFTFGLEEPRPVDEACGLLIHPPAGRGLPRVAKVAEFSGFG